MSIVYAWALIRRRLMWIILVAVLCASGAYGIASVRSTYAVTAHVVLEPTEGSLAVRAVDPERFLSTQGQRLLSDTVLDAAAESLRDGTAVDDLRKAVSLRNAPGSDVLEVSVSGTEPETAEQRGAAVVAAFREQSSAQVAARALWVDGPSVLFSPLRAAVIGAGAGAALMTLLTLVVGLVRRPVLSPTDVELDAGLATVYPGVMTPRWAEKAPVRDSYVRLLVWLRAFAGERRAEIVLVPVGGTGEQGFAHAMQRALDGAEALAEHSAGPEVTVSDAASMLRVRRDPGSRRVVVFLAQQGVTTERQIETTVNGLVTPDEACAVVILGRRPL